MCLDLFFTDCDGTSATVLAEEYENIKHNLKNILQSSEYCGICLDNNKNTNKLHVDELITLDLPTTCSMEVMMNELFGEMLTNNIPTKYVCEHCIQNVKRTYDFINKVKIKSHILQSYIEQMESHIEEIENMLNSNETNNVENTIIVLQNLVSSNNDSVSSEDINVDDSCFSQNESYDGANSDYLHDLTEESINEEYLEDEPLVNTKRMIRCEYCDTKCNDDASKNAHQDICKFEKKKYVCRKCKVWFSKKNKLLAHMEDYHDVLQYNARCYKCMKGFLSETGLKKHVERIHEQKPQMKLIKSNVKKPRYCSICPEVFDSIADLRKHLNTHDPGETHKCHECNKQFDSRKTYNCHVHSFSHRRKVDPDAKFGFKCPECHLSFNNNSLLENHKNTEHLKVKPYICTICGRQFPAEIKLRYHMNRHKGIKQFQCSECSGMFTSASGLKKHGLRYHSAERPIPCDMCNKSFVCQSEYNLHKQRNHSEKLLSCPICETKFYSQANLRPHIQKVHMKGKNLEEFLTSEDVPDGVDELLRDHRLVF